MPRPRMVPAVSQLAKALDCNWKGLDLRRGFMVAGVLLVLTLLLVGLGHVKKRGAKAAPAAG
jgi:hypothetical protein